MEAYIKDFCPNDILDRTEEVKLFQQLSEGEEEIKDILIKYNIRLVINIAKKYRNCGIEMDDLIQEGILGLIKAIEKFDYTKGFKFSTYAMHWIKNYVLKAIYLKNKAIRAPHWLIEDLNKINKYSEGHSLTSFYDAANELGISKSRVDKIIFYLNSSSFLKSLSDTVSGEELLVEDLIEDKPELFINEKIDLSTCIEHLSEREQYIISRRFFYGNTLQEIGDDLDLTRERVRKIEYEALKKMKKELSYKEEHYWA